MPEDVYKRQGYTTGTCAALAAAGAARLLLTDTAPETVALRTPKGIVVEVAPLFCRTVAEGAELSLIHISHQLQRILYLLFVLGGKDAQPPGVGDASCRRKLKAGGQLGAAGVGPVSYTHLHRRPW